MQNDAELSQTQRGVGLIGNPYILIFGKSLAQGQVEFRKRQSGEKSEIALGEITSYLVKLLG